MDDLEDRRFPPSTLPFQQWQHDPVGSAGLSTPPTAGFQLGQQWSDAESDDPFSFFAAEDLRLPGGGGAALGDLPGKDAGARQASPPSFQELSAPGPAVELEQSEGLLGDEDDGDDVDMDAPQHGQCDQLDPWQLNHRGEGLASFSVNRTGHGGKQLRTSVKAVSRLELGNWSLGADERIVVRIVMMTLSGVQRREFTAAGGTGHEFCAPGAAKIQRLAEVEVEGHLRSDPQARFLVRLGTVGNKTALATDAGRQKALLVRDVAYDKVLRASRFVVRGIEPITAAARAKISILAAAAGTPWSAQTAPKNVLA